MLAVAIVEYLIAPFAANPLTFTEFYCIICAVTAVAGHCWMPYLGFKGGKGLGTYVGLLFYFYWPVAFIWIFLLFTMIKITGFAGYGACWSVSLIVPVLYFFDVLTQTLGLGKLPLDFWPHVYLNDALTSNGPLGWQFILLFALAMWLVLFIRHIPEFRRIKRGEAKAWKSLKTKEMLK
jgi:glycerol-3-phosphate acyltransferase PlsY